MSKFGFTRQKILDVLNKNSNEDKECFMSTEEIANQLGLKEGTIFAQFTLLEREGCIKRSVENIQDPNNGRIIGQRRTIKILKDKINPIKQKDYCIPYVNDIATTHPEVIQFLLDPEDAHRYMHGSDKKIMVRCLNCGFQKLRIVSELCNSGFNCPRCGDKISYPNKFVRAFLEQLSIDNLQYEYKDDWTQGKVYDNYFEYQNKKYLVEVDGNQHERDTQWSTYEYQRDNDALKDRLAFENSYHIIRIPCGRSRNYKIEETLLNSEFSSIFDLSNIDWQFCRQRAMSNRMIEICNYINDNPQLTNKAVAKFFKVGTGVITTALKRGRELGIINRKEGLFLVT